MLDLFIIAALQAATYGIAALGLSIAFRIIKFPDLTADGSFMIGAACYAAILLSGSGWVAALVGAALGGAMCGIVTHLFSDSLRVNRLLAGILTSMVAYSVAFRQLGGRANVGLNDISSIFSTASGAVGELCIAALLALSVALAIAWIIGSEFGLVLRATGSNRTLVQSLGRHPARYVCVGLIVANALVAFAGALVSALQGFADVNMGPGSVVAFVASLVIGEELLRLLPQSRGKFVVTLVGAPFVGSLLFYFFNLLMLRLSIIGVLPVSIQPTDLKMVSALIVVLALQLRRYHGAKEDIMPLN
jgi:putative tryptophan/tyrosine transport system permease protein